jgi:hypothetical protein
MIEIPIKMILCQLRRGFSSRRVCFVLDDRFDMMITSTNYFTITFLFFYESHPIARTVADRTTPALPLPKMQRY